MNKIKGFDGIRALSIISVVMLHLNVFGYLHEIGLLDKKVIPMLNCGLQMFFVLSGFLITTLLIKEYERNNKILLRSFYIRRSLRIFPVYFLFVFILTTIHSLGVNTDTCWEALQFAYIYIYNFIPRIWYSRILGHTWSLSVEEHFYLFWPIFFVILFSKKSKVLIYGLFCFIFISWISRNILLLSDIQKNFFTERWTFVAGSDIAMGCLMALIITDYRNESKDYWCNLFANKTNLVVGFLLYSNSVFLGHDPYRVSIYIRGLGITLIIAWIYLNQTSLFVRILEFYPLRYIGLISYGIYIYHGFFIGSGPYRAPGQTWPPSPLTGLLLLIITAPLSYHFFEKPFIQLKERFK